MIAKAIAIIAAATVLSTAAFADPVGTYRVRGTNPNGSEYAGEVRVVRTGKTYQVTWRIGGETYSGTGIGSDDFLAVSYRAGNQSGLALYGRKGDRWDGIWTYAGGRDVGTDRWTPLN